MTNLRDEVREKVGIAVGHGSLCWEPRPIGVFDSTEASKAVDTATTEILQAIEREVKAIVAKEKVFWDDRTDKFGVGVRVGIEAMEYRMNELLGVKV